MNNFWIKHGDARYQKFYMGMMFHEGRYWDKDENGDWYSVGIDKEGYPEFEKVYESKTGMGSEPRKEAV